MPYRPTQFQSTVVKLYHKDDSFKPLQDILENVLENILKNILKDVLEDVLKENHNQYALKGDYDSNIIVIDIP